MPKLIDTRREYSLRRLDELRRSVAGVAEIANLKDLCVYVTGSYGRLEASESSDLDLFFIHAGSSAQNRISGITETLLRADLIRKCRDLSFPEFSGDGEYLEIHYLGDIKEQLGSPTDDYENLFTARLLLLLESRPICNEGFYERVVGAVIESYYRDFHDHQTDFRPIFLTNDIIRFWKTLCLNYEHQRNRPAKDGLRKNKSHLKNLKLKFSRMMTCFSTVICLSDGRYVTGPEQLLSLVQQSPLERLEAVASQTQQGRELLMKIQEDYEWFLQVTGHPKEQVLTWIAKKLQRDRAFDRARTFGKHMYELLVLTTAESDTLRFLVI